MTSRFAAVALNLTLRVWIARLLVEVLTDPDDHRFKGKAIPVWTDDLWLSLFWLDMAGNSFDLYDRYTHFDLIPHLHGTGASAVAIERAFGSTRRQAFFASNALHAALEAQEYATDVLFGTHNVRGWWDSAGDLLAGLLGTAIYLRAER